MKKIDNLLSQVTTWIVAAGIAALCLAGCSQSGDGEPAQTLLNDTGITRSGNYPRGVNDDCSKPVADKSSSESEPLAGDLLSQQDCTRGRDAKVADAADGAAGFVYRKVGDSSELLDADAEQWTCVLDEISGLLWEVKAPTDGTYGNRGLRDGDDVFTWYNPNRDANGGAIGDWNARFNQCTGYVEGKPQTYCNIEEFVSRVNQHGLCGFKDWRLPSLPELAGLVNYGRVSPSIDKAYFPNTRDGFYWSHTPDAKLDARAWAVNFQYGYSAPMPRDNGRHVRLVRDWQPRSENSENTDSKAEAE